MGVRTTSGRKAGLENDNVGMCGGALVECESVVLNSGPARKPSVLEMWHT